MTDSDMNSVRGSNINVDRLFTPKLDDPVESALVTDAREKELDYQRMS